MDFLLVCLFFVGGDRDLDRDLVRDREEESELLLEVSLSSLESSEPSVSVSSSTPDKLGVPINQILDSYEHSELSQFSKNLNHEKKNIIDQTVDNVKMRLNLVLIFTAFKYLML